MCLDNDAAGEDATQRALALLRGSDLEVKVLRLPQKRGEDGTLGKQDPDDYIKRYGGQAFEALMNRSENSVEYRLGQVQGKYDLEKDDQRSAYLQEAAGLIAGLSSPVGTGNLRRPGGGCRPHLPRGHGPGGGAPAPAEKLAGPAQTGTAGPGAGPAAPAQGAGLAIQQSAFRQGGRKASFGWCCWTEPISVSWTAWAKSIFPPPYWGKPSACCGSGGGRTVRPPWRQLEADREFSPQEMDLLSGIVQQPQPRHTAQAALEDNLAIVLEEAGKGPLPAALIWRI